MRGADGVEPLSPVDGLRNPGQLLEIHFAKVIDRGDDLGGEVFRDARQPRAHDVNLTVGFGETDPGVEAAALQRVVQFAGAVRGEDDDRPRLGFDGAHFGNGDLEVAEKFEQKRFELVVRAVDLVDEQNAGIARSNGLHERSLDQEAFSEQILLRALGPRVTQRANVEHLPGVVPLVDGVVNVDALVALESDELAAGHPRHGAGQLCLADSHLTFKQQRLAQLKGEEQRRGEPTIGDVVLCPQLGNQVADFTGTLGLGHRATLVLVAVDEVGETASAEFALLGEGVAPGRLDVSTLVCVPVETDVLHVPAYLGRAALSVEILKVRGVLLPDTAEHVSGRVAGLSHGVLLC